MSKRICRICLRTDLNTRDIHEKLVDFHDEMTDYSVYENSALKYCSICEHLLLKFYNFSLKCKKANKILKGKSFKRAKNGGYPNNVHELLPPTSLGFSTLSTLQQFYLNNGVLEPIQNSVNQKLELSIKQEYDNIEVKNEIEFHDNMEADTLQTDDVYQETQTEEIGKSDVIKICDVRELMDDQQGGSNNKTLAEMASIDSEDEKNITIIKNSLSPTNVQSIEEEQTCEEQNIEELEVKLEYTSDLSSPKNDYSEDSSDAEMINELKKRIQCTSKARVNKKDSFPKSTLHKKPNLRQPLKKLKEYENVFDIQLFASDVEAKEELEYRKTIEPYLSAEHKCLICYKVFKYAKLLDFHMRWHDLSAGDHECSICSMRFRCKNSIRRHKYGSHYGKFVCKMCPLITYLKSVMETHYERHAGVIFTCKLCDRSFKHASTFKTHMRLRHKTEHVCVTCARTFVSEKGLLRHRSLIHRTESKVDSEATVHCAPCGLTFANKQVYIVHVTNTDKHKQLAETIVACKVCGILFENKVDLREHKRSKHPNQMSNKSVSKSKANTDAKDSYKCTICGKVGTSNIWVSRHVLSTHPDSPYAKDLEKRKRHMCDTCGKCYTTIYALRDHMNLHSGVKPYACDSCPMRFGTRSYLVLHADKHASVRRHVCSHCGKKFVSASNLSNHMRFHIQDRRYKCSVCNKGFLHSATLREHIRGVHHNVRRVRKGVKREAAKQKEKA